MVKTISYSIKQSSRLGILWKKVLRVEDKKGWASKFNPINLLFSTPQQFKFMFLIYAILEVYSAKLRKTNKRQEKNVFIIKFQYST